MPNPLGIDGNSKGERGLRAREEYNSQRDEGSRGGVVVRVLASHQCVPGSIPGHGVICGLSLLLVLVLLRGFFSRFSSFPPSAKTNISKFQFNQEFEGHGFIS